MTLYPLYRRPERVPLGVLVRAGSRSSCSSRTVEMYRWSRRYHSNEVTAIGISKCCRDMQQGLCWLKCRSYPELPDLSRIAAIRHERHSGTLADESQRVMKGF